MKRKDEKLKLMNTEKLKEDPRQKLDFKEQVSVLSSLFQRNCAKLASRYSGEYKEQDPQQTNGAGNGTIHGSLPTVDKAPSPQLTYRNVSSVHEFKATKEIKNLSEERDLHMSKIEATRGIMSKRTTPDGVPGKKENFLSKFTGF